MTKSEQLGARIRGLGLNIVMSKPAGDHDLIAMLCRGKDSYAVCRVNVTLGVVQAPRYHQAIAVEPDAGLLSAAVSQRGFEEVLDWTDRRTALDRYQGLGGQSTPAAPATRPVELHAIA